MKIEQLRQELQHSLDHFIHLGNVVKDSYPKLYPSEKGLMVYSLLVAARRLAKMMKEAQEWQTRFIPDVIGIDWVETRGYLLNLMEYLSQSNCDMKIGYALRDGATPFFDGDEIVNEENRSQFFPPKEHSQAYINARQLLIEDSTGNYADMEIAINGVIEMIEDLLDDAKKMKRDDDARMERMKEMESYYIRKYWEWDKSMLVARAKDDLSNKDNKGKTHVEILGNLLRELNADNLRNNNNKILAIINAHRDDRDYVAKKVVENRDKVSVDEMMEHFKFRESCKILNNHIDALFLLEPCEKYEGRLFVNEASYEFVKLIMGAIDLYVSFGKKKNASFFFAALKDLGLVCQNENNAKLMAAFLKEEYEEDISPDTITKPLRQCVTFCTLDDNRTGAFSTREFTKYKEIYWLCFSIIQKVLDKKNIRCADYLKSLHRSIETNDVFKDLEEKDRSRLYFLSSVLRGEATMF